MTTTTPLSTGTSARRLPAGGTESVLPVVLAVLAAGLTAVGSWIPSLWGDEAATAMSAQRSWSSLFLELRHVDAVHGAYYALMHLWVGVFGAGPVALRAPSAIALGATVAGVVVLTRLSGGSRATAVVVAICTTLLPRLAYQGEEARAYAIDAAVATWTVVAVCALLRGRSRVRSGWAVVTVLTVVGTYLFLYVGLMVLVTGGLVLSSPYRARHLRAWIVSSVTTVVAVLPIVVVGVLQRAQVSFLVHRVTTDPASVLVSVYFGRTWVAGGGWALVAIAIAAAVRSRVRSARPGRTLDPGARPSLVTVGVLWALLPLAVLVAANPVVHEFSARYATFTAPGTALLVASGFDVVRRRSRWAAVLAGAVAVAVVVPVWIGERTPTSFNGSDWSTSAALVRTHARPGDQVAFDVTVRPSRRELLAMRTYPGDFAGLRQVQVTTPYWRNTSWDDRAVTVAQAAEEGRFRDGRVWLLQDAHGGTVDREGETALADEGFHRVGSWRAPTSAVVLYER